jgi:hypothetical protein
MSPVRHCSAEVQGDYVSLAARKVSSQIALLFQGYRSPGKAPVRHGLFLPLLLPEGYTQR